MVFLGLVIPTLKKNLIVSHRQFTNTHTKPHEHLLMHHSTCVFSTPRLGFLGLGLKLLVGQGVWGGGILHLWVGLFSAPTRSFFVVAYNHHHHHQKRLIYYAPYSTPPQFLLFLQNPPVFFQPNKALL